MSKLAEYEADINNPVIVADSEGVIMWVNKAFEQAFEWQSEDLSGKLLNAIMPAKFHDAHNLGLSRFIVSGQATLLDQPLDLEIVTKSGAILKARHTIIAELKDGEMRLAARIIPILTE